MGTSSVSALRTALQRLGPRQRAVIVLRYWLDLTEHETAAALNCSVGTVKSQASRALAALRRGAHLTLLVDVSVEVAAARRARRGGQPELFEADDTQQRVIARYREEAEEARARGERVVIVDGTPDEETVFQALRAQVAETCGLGIEGAAS